LSRSLLPLSSVKEVLLVCFLLCLLLLASARTRTKQAREDKEESKPEGTTFLLVAFFFVVLTYYTSLYFIRILFPSKPIHELRLNLNVANTVIALTIRVIYLSLIITLKRGVVVLWFTVTCPLSSGFLLTIFAAEQFLSPKSTKRFPHTHQALTISKHKQEQDTRLFLKALRSRAQVFVQSVRGCHFGTLFLVPLSETPLPDVISGPHF